MYKFNDRWVRIGGILLLLLPLVFNELTSAGFHRPLLDEVFYISFYMASVALFLEMGRRLILWKHRQYPGLQQRQQRFSQSALLVSVTNCSLILFTFEASHWVRHIHPNLAPMFVAAVGIVSIILAFTQVAIYEGLYYFIRLRQVEKEKEELQRMQLQSQFDSLKQQVNPHFLFNSINTVSALIDKDATKAKRYLSEMSKVYRYLLRANEEELTSLQTELNFLHSYFHLLKTRFSEGLFLEVHIADAYTGYYLPTLTLQLLVENAVKHNTIEKARPLKIAIFTTEDGNLRVSNNLQKRTNLFSSSGLGLANITAKYKLLNRPEVQIIETPFEFSVQIPLILSRST